MNRHADSEREHARVVFGGQPDRLVNQYEALSLCFHPFFMTSPLLKKGQENVVNAWGVTNSFLRPEMFEEFFLEPCRRIYGYYHEHGVEMIVHHSDSYAANLVPYMIEMGINVWQGCMKSNDVPALIEKYGDKITFMGGIDNKMVDFEGWKPEDCYKAADSVIGACGGLRKGFIPCITQGGPGSVFPGTYKCISDEICRYNTEKFGFTKEEQEAGAPPMVIMF